MRGVFTLPGGVLVTVFSLLIAVGAVLGLYQVARLGPEKDIRRRVDTGVLVLFAGLVGGRLVYVLVHWHYFRYHPLEAAFVWLGGLSWAGAMAGAVLALVLIAWFTHLSFGLLADELLPLLAILSVSIWMACWLVGSVYGPEVSAWWGVPARDEWGVMTTRWPLQPMGAALTLVLFWLLERSRRQTWMQVPGRAAALGVGGLSTLLLGSSLSRADPVPMWNGLHLDTWAAIVFVVGSVFTFLLTFVRRARGGTSNQ